MKSYKQSLLAAVLLIFWIFEIWHWNFVIWEVGVRTWNYFNPAPPRTYSIDYDPNAGVSYTLKESSSVLSTNNIAVGTSTGPDSSGMRIYGNIIIGVGDNKSKKN